MTESKAREKKGGDDTCEEERTETRTIDTNGNGLSRRVFEEFPSLFWEPIGFTVKPTHV